jgi:hypothetical protein
MLVLVDLNGYTYVTICTPTASCALSVNRQAKVSNAYINVGRRLWFRARSRRAVSQATPRAGISRLRRKQREARNGDQNG